MVLTLNIVTDRPKKTIYTERKKKRRVEFFPSYFNHFYGVYYSHTLLQIVL